MVKRRLRESIKSLLGSHLDPDKDEQLQRAKTEIEDKVKRILKLVKDDNLEEDGTPAELSNKGPLVELIEDVNYEYQSLHAQYDHITGVLRKKFNGKGEKESSSFSPDSDYSSRDEDIENGQMEDEFHNTIDGLKHELAMARIEVAELNLKLTSTHEEKEDLNSKYVAALSKIHEADKINLDLKTDGEALGIQTSKLLVENDELKQQLDITGKIEAEQSQKLEDSKKITDGMRIMVDQLQDENFTLGEELEAVTGELSILKQQLEHAEQQDTKISQNLKVAEEENESLKSKLSQVTYEVQLAHNRIQELEAESIQLKEFLDDRYREASSLIQKHAGYQNESSSKIKELEAQVAKLELGIDMEDKIKNGTTEARELGELQNKISEHETKCKERQELLSALMKKLEDIDNDSLSKIAYLTSQIHKLLSDSSTLHAQKIELEEQIIFISNEASDQVKSVTDEAKRLQLEVESLQYQISDWEIQLVEKVQENFEYTIRMQALKEEIDRKALEQEILKRDLEEKGYDINTLLEKVRMLEIKLGLSNQKLRVAEQLLTEKEESFTKLEEKFRQEQMALEDKVTTLSAIISANNEAFQEIISDIKENVSSVMTSIETVSLKFSDDCKNYEASIANISHELQVAKTCVSEMNKEKEELKNERQHLLEKLKSKNKEELALKVVVERLEAKARREELKKTNLNANVVELKKKIEELEKGMKEKNDGMLNLGEEKREAIRQLCLWIDYHRDRYDNLKDIISKTRRGQKGA
ncbi:hypothetical protein Lal_00013885 [Lupinus albus]|uniref:Uncharacterized protein n=1 Tax=Lupinus albus TaxID=3870 RepID=A0A6A5MRP7_LUPAL|nr:putative protein Networked (NET), actin-binding (NAB) [Lupinus albus]KAF1873920.1 hypothetical protein Lal_00013885 [Lupinus albus]